MKIGINNEIFSHFPGVTEYIVIAKGCNNETSKSKEIRDLLREEEEKLAKDYTSEKELLDDVRFSAWVDAYSKILDELVGDNRDSKKYEPAHLALAKRVVNGKSIPNINPIVNLYNAYSLKYRIPVGGEDLGQVYGDLQLKVAKGDEKFVGIGDLKVSDIHQGEVVWGDGHSVACRMWNWRQSERTKVTKEASDVYFVFDFLPPVEKGLEVSFEHLVDEFAKGLERYLSASAEVYSLNESGSDIELSYTSKGLGNLDNIEEDLKSYTTKERKVKKQKGVTSRRPESLELETEENYITKLDKLLSYILKSLGSEFESNEFLGLEYSPNPKYGDLSTSAPLKLAGKLKRNPREIAEKIKESAEDMDQFAEVSIAPNNFVNFRIQNLELIKKSLEIVEDFESFSRFRVGDDRVMLIESPSPNPNKPMHIGHLLNLFIGTSLKRIWGSAGFKVFQDTIVNDRGVPIMKTAWAIQNLSEYKSPEEAGKRPDVFVGENYVKGSEKYNQDDKVKAEINQLLIDWEKEEEDVREIADKIIDWVIEGQLKTASRVWEDFGHLWYESEIYEEGRDTILEYVDGEKIERLDDGAVIGRIEEEYGVPDVVLVKSDGTSLYHTQDVQLTKLKIEKFDPWKAVWVVGNEQIVHFQRLFSLLDMIDLLPIENLYHYAYGFVYGKDGKKMSSRTGEALSGDELIDIVKEAAIKAIWDRDVAASSEVDEDELAEIVAINALKFSFLVTDPFKDINFDIDQAVAFNGKTGSYVMYAYARGMSVLDKHSVSETKVGLDRYPEVMTDIDHEILMKCMQYQEVLLNSANRYMPSYVAEYIYELAKLFNNFYENESVQDAEAVEKAVRLHIIKVVTNILEDGMKILGMKPLKVM